MTRTPCPHDAAADLCRQYGLTADDLVVEVGSGDGGLLRAVRSHGPRVLGVEPDARAAARAFGDGVDTVVAAFTSPAAADIRRRYGPARLVLARSARPAGRDLQSFAAAARVLAPGGAVVILSAGADARAEVRPDAARRAA